jgi:hypothetical protein
MHCGGCCICLILHVCHSADPGDRLLGEKKPRPTAPGSRDTVQVNTTARAAAAHHNISREYNFYKCRMIGGESDPVSRASFDSLFDVVASTIERAVHSDSVMTFPVAGQTISGRPSLIMATQVRI